MFDKLLNSLVASGERAIEFIAAQGPLLAADVVAYGRAYHSTMIVLAIILAWICCEFCRAVWPDVEAGKDNPAVIIKVIGAIVFGIVAPVIFASNINYFFMAWFAPRLFVLAYLGVA